MRQAAAEQLASAVEVEIQRLGMPGGRFSAPKPAAEGELMPYGLEVEFLVSANLPAPGTCRRIRGELSRISRRFR